MTSLLKTDVILHQTNFDHFFERTTKPTTKDSGHIARVLEMPRDRFQYNLLVLEYSLDNAELNRNIVMVIEPRMNYFGAN
jgi:hypothetical protein